MASNPLDDLFEKRKHEKEQKAHQKKVELERRNAHYTESIGIMQDACVSIYSAAKDAANHANSQLEHTKIYTIVKNKTALDDSHTLKFATTNIVAASRNSHPSTIKDLNNHFVLSFEASLDSRTITSSLSKRGKREVIKEYQSMDANWKEAVYSEVAAFLERNGLL